MRRILKALAMLTFGVALLAISATANAAECQFKFCRYQQTTGTTTRAIVNINRQRLGDLYTPIPGGRTQIRDNSLRIKGYILPDGTITDPNRRRLGDLYTPIPGGRTQIRDNSLRIKGYILPDGTITDPNRRRVGNIEDLLK